MKSVIAILIAIVILGGGYYWYTSQQQAAMDADTSMESMEMSTEGTNTDAMDAMMEESSSATPTSSAGTGVSANVSTSVSTGAVKEFTVHGKSFSFTPAAMTVKKGDRVRITFINDGGTHDWVIDEFNARTKVIQGGAQETIEFVADKAGSFEYYCSVGQHRQMGMKGTLTVTN